MLYLLLEVFSTFKSFIYGGVDYDIPGNGGISCFYSLSIKRRICESLVIISFSLWEIWWSLKKIDKRQLKSPVEPNTLNHCILKKYCSESTISLLRKLMLLSLLAIFSLEIAYKITEGSLIYLLNPCHVITFFQIYFLLPNTSPEKTKRMFRVHLHLLSGPLLAILLPVTNTRTRLFEVESYWLHHFFIYICAPLFLFASDGCFKSESLTDYYWPTLSAGVGFLYHFMVLQPIAMMTQVNLNNILCPAISDPFAGDNYRAWAFAHQHLLIFLHAKLYPLCAFLILTLMDYLIRGSRWLTVVCQSKLITSQFDRRRSSNVIPGMSAASTHEKFD